MQCDVVILAAHELILIRERVFSAHFLLTQHSATLICCICMSMLLLTRLAAVRTILVQISFQVFTLLLRNDNLYPAKHYYCSSLYKFNWKYYFPQIWGKKLEHATFSFNWMHWSKILSRMHVRWLGDRAFEPRHRASIFTKTVGVAVGANVCIGTSQVTQLIDQGLHGSFGM